MHLISMYSTPWYILFIHIQIILVHPNAQYCHSPAYWLFLAPSPLTSLSANQSLSPSQCLCFILLSFLLGSTHSLACFAPAHHEHYITSHHTLCLTVHQDLLFNSPISFFVVFTCLDLHLALFTPDFNFPAQRLNFACFMDLATCLAFWPQVCLPVDWNLYLKSLLLERLIV